MTVRFFRENSLIELERKINDFINANSNIVDIKFSTTSSYGQLIYYTAMVIME